MSKLGTIVKVLLAGVAVVGVLVVAFWAWIREKVIEFMQTHQIERLENLFLTIDPGVSMVRRIFTLMISTVGQPSSFNMQFEDDSRQEIAIDRKVLIPEQEEIPADVLAQLEALDGRKEFDISLMLSSLTH